VGEYDHSTLYLLFQLSVDLVNMGELDEAESLFRRLLTLQQQVLSPGDIFIGRAVSGLSRTLELAGRLEEALMYTRQAFDHYLVHEGSDSWFTNRQRLDLAGLMHKLGHNAEALRQLNDLQECLSARNGLEDPGHQLLEEAFMLHQQIMTGKVGG
jgi:tetratricopeptide (TPR) repeat protein